MDDNEKRVERMKKVLRCKRDIELAKRLNQYPPNITRWKKRGFYPSTASLIDELLNEYFDLDERFKKLKNELKAMKDSAEKT